jgi:outer membrane biosynthesis protein TonB
MLQFQDTSGLFENFEVNATPFWPKVSRLIGGSIVLHLVLVACVVFIPPVRDALSIAAMFSDVGFVDRAYKKTEIEAGDITEITTEKFHYPEGYFAMDQMGFPSPSPTPLVVVQQFNPAPVPPTQFDPTKLPTPTPSPSAVPVAGVSPTPTPTAEEDAARKAAEAELDKMAAESGVKRPKEINTLPFKDLLADAKKKKDRGELKLEGEIELTVEADLGPDGKLINAKVIGGKGDKSLESTALGFVAALSDSGVLDFLEGMKHLRVNVKLDQTNVEVVAASEVETEDRARQLERTFGGMIVLGRIVKHGKDEEVYYNHTQVSSKEKEVSVKFAMPRAEMGAMLSKYTTAK